MPQVNAGDLAALRDQFQWSKFYLGVLVPETVHTSQINYATIPRGEVSIPFDGGAYAAGFGAGSVVAGMTLWVGTTANSHDICKLRIRTPYNRTCTPGDAFSTGDGGITGTITVCEHNYLLGDNYYLTVKEEFRLWPKHPICQQGGLDVLWYQDYDIQYCGQNRDASRDPIVRMGPPGVAIRDGATGLGTVRFWSNSGAAPGGGAPGAYAWTWRGGTLQSGPGAAAAGTAANPNVVTWNNTGNYLATLTLDGSVSGYRPVFIYDATGTNIPYEDFEVQNISGDFDTGGWRMSVRVKEECAEADFPEESMIILFAEDWYKGDQVSIGGNYRHRENNIFVGYITKESVRKDPYTDDVLFEAHTIDGEMKGCEQFPHSMEDSPTANANWLQIQNMTMDKSAYFIAQWRSTLLDITDVHFSGDAKLVRWFDVAQKSLYEQLDADCYNSAVLGRCLSDRMGIVHCEINPQFLDVGADRDALATIMDIQEQDWRNEIELPKPQTSRTSLIDLSGLRYAGGLADVEITFSLAHGDVPMERGRGIQKDNLVLQSQDQANRVAGNFLANQNNPYPNVRVPIGLNYRVFDIAPQEWVTMSLAASDTYRGVTWTDERFIPRTVNFNLENMVGALNVDLGLEMESSGTVGVAGHYPTEPPEDDYTPPPTPVPPPWVPPTEGDGKVVYACTTKGVARCNDVTASPAVWTAINNGLGADLDVRCARFQFSGASTKRAVISTQTNIYTGSGVDGTPTWTSVLTLAQAKTLTGDAGLQGFVGPKTQTAGNQLAGNLVTSSIFEINYIGVFAYRVPGNVQHYYLHSHDWGATWSSVMLAGTDRLIVPRYSNHTYNKIHIMHFFKSTAGNPDRGAYEYSNDGGHTFTIVNFTDLYQPGGVHLRDWGIPYKKSDGSLNSDEKECWLADYMGGVNAARRSTTGITPAYTARGDAAMAPGGERQGQSVHTPLHRVMIENRAGGSVCHMWMTKDGGASWTAPWSIPDDYYIVCLAGFPYSGDYFYWGGYRADANAVYTWYTRDGFVTTVDFKGNLATVLGLVSGNKLHVLTPDFTV